MKNKVNYNSNRKYRDFDLEKEESNQESLEKVDLKELKKSKLELFKFTLRNFFKK